MSCVRCAVVHAASQQAADTAEWAQASLVTLSIVESESLGSSPCSLMVVCRRHQSRATGEHTETGGDQGTAAVVPQGLGQSGGGKIIEWSLPSLFPGGPEMLSDANPKHNELLGVMGDKWVFLSCSCYSR